MSFPKNYTSTLNEIERIKAHFDKRITQPCYVVGNGPSSAQVRLTTDEISTSVIFRANWFFLEKEKNYGERVDGFFWSVDNEGLRNKLAEVQIESKYNIGAFFQPFYASDSKDQMVSQTTAALMPNMDHWAVIASHPTLARFMMGRPLPTQGMQMIAFAAILGFRKIYVSGIDLYNDIAKRYAWNVPESIRSHLQEKDVTAGYENKHSLDLDLHFLRAVRSNFDFELIGLSHMEILAPFLDRSAQKTLSVTRESSEPLHKHKKIYTTLADGRYAIGAMALARSLAKVTDIPLLVLHSDPQVPRLLAHIPNIITKSVEPLANPHTHGQARFALTFTKLQVFKLTEFDRITFIDSDAVVLKNIDDLFEMNGFWAAPDWGVNLNAQFNSGVFSFTPSHDLERKVFSAISEAGSSDGGDQGFLNSILGADVRWLPIEYNTLKRLPIHHPNLININECKVLHFVGDNPWDMHCLNREYSHLEYIWSSFLEKKDWQHEFWMNKNFVSRRWKGQSTQTPKHAANPPAQNTAPGKKSTRFEKRLASYSPTKRFIVGWGDKLLPSLIAKPVDRLLKKSGVL